MVTQYIIEVHHLGASMKVIVGTADIFSTLKTDINLAITQIPGTTHLDRFVLILYYSFKNWRIPMEAYCMKCRAKKEMKDARRITMKNGKPATQGVCPTCGTKMYKIGKG